MCIFTTVLIIISREYSTFCTIKCSVLLKIISPLEYIRIKRSVQSNRIQTNNSCSLNIVDTSIENFNTGNSSSIFSISINRCFSNSTKTIALNNNFWCSSISTTSRNNSNRNNSTIINNCLSNCSRTRTQRDCRFGCI